VIEMDLGKIIFNYRKKFNLSQEDLAKEIGVTRQTISKWELNETSPDLKQAIKLAEIFDIDFNNILGRNNKEEKNINEKSSKTKHILLIVLLSFSIIVILSLISIFFYNYGYNKNHSKIYIVCKLDNEEYNYAITYDDTNDILLTDGSKYIYENIYNKKKYKKTVNLITDVNNYFENNGGYCE